MEILYIKLKVIKFSRTWLHNKDYIYDFLSLFDMESEPVGMNLKLSPNDEK